MAETPRWVRVSLLVVAGLNLVSALAGMVGLTIGGGMGIPRAWLDASPFDSYFWPGLILGGVVGGTQLIAIVAQCGNYRLARGAHVTAGLVMMIWIFVEIAMMLVWSPLHGVFFGTGLVQVVFGVLALGAWPRPLLARDPR